MIQVAGENGVRLGTNHNYLFNPCIIASRRLLDRGEIGDVVYVDSYYGLSEEGGSYSSIAGRSHWEWRLPGSAFTNFLPHLIYLQLAFLSSPVVVSGVTLAHSDQVEELPSELTVLLQGSGGSGVMAISMRARPYAKFVNIYGTKGMIHADLTTEVCTLHKSHRLPGMLTKVFFNLEESLQLASKTTLNTAKVAVGSLARNPGLLGHLREFYASIEANKPLPVSGKDGKMMLEIMEQVGEITDRRLKRPSIFPGKPKTINPKTKAEQIISERGLPGKVLVTGATGFLGVHLVEALSRCGASVRVLVHNKDRVPFQLEQLAEIAYGDLRDQAAIEAAVQGTKIVFHCAAVTKNNADWETHRAINIAGTERVFKAALKADVDRVIHISSIIVYGLARSRHNGVIDESAPYSPKQDRWAHYLRSKVEADKLALAIWKEAHLPVTVLRLGILYGPGEGRSMTRGLIQLGPFRFMIGSGRNHLPFTYVGNAVDAILLAAISPAATGQAYNVVDEPQISVRDAIQETQKINGERIITIPVPPFLLTSLAKMLEWRANRADSHTPPKLSSFVVRSACRDLYYDTRKAGEQLGWSQEVAFRDGLKKAISSQGK